MGSRQSSTISLFESKESIQSKKSVILEKPPEELDNPEDNRLAIKITSFIKNISIRKDYLKIRKYFKIFENKIDFEYFAKIAPKLSPLYKDSLLNIKIRFRLAGETFPPQIIYKIIFSDIKTDNDIFKHNIEPIKEKNEVSK